MRIEQLRYFIDVAQTQSLTRSASNLFISPQGLSQAITALEKECGMTFFERSKNGLVLNDKGSALRELAIDLCARVDTFNLNVAQLADVRTELGKEAFSLYLPPLIILGDALAPLMDELEHAFSSVDLSARPARVPARPVCWRCRSMQGLIRTFPACSMRTALRRSIWYAREATYDFGNPIAWKRPAPSKSRRYVCCSRRGPTLRRLTAGARRRATRMAC